jgi:hypothetical protein
VHKFARVLCVIGHGHVETCRSSECQRHNAFQTSDVLLFRVNTMRAQVCELAKDVQSHAAISDWDRITTNLAFVTGTLMESRQISQADADAANSKLAIAKRAYEFDIARVWVSGWTYRDDVSFMELPSLDALSIGLSGVDKSQLAKTMRALAPGTPASMRTFAAGNKSDKKPVPGKAATVHEVAFSVLSRLADENDVAFAARRSAAHKERSRIDKLRITLPSNDADVQKRRDYVNNVKSRKDKRARARRESNRAKLSGERRAAAAVAVAPLPNITIERVNAQSGDSVTAKDEVTFVIKLSQPIGQERFETRKYVARHLCACL